MPKNKDFSGSMVTDEERKKLSSGSQGALGRAAMGSPMTEDETRTMANEIRDMRGRPMFGSTSLERELYKIKNGK